MPQKPEKERKPTPPEAWERAKHLKPEPTARQPEMVGDGGGLPFATEATLTPFQPLDPSEPSVAALLLQIDRSRRQNMPQRPMRPRAMPPHMETADKLAGWRVLASTDDEILYGRGRPPELLTISVRRNRRGRWSALGVSNRRPLRVTRDGVRASSWRLDPDFRLAPDTRELRILVTEQTMSSGALADDRLLTPEIYLDDDELLLRLYVRPIEGYVGRAKKYETPVIIDLPESVGDRKVLDGALYEPPSG
jgi:hypothetical protein